MVRPVTDPQLLAQLNGEPQPVTDPALLEQLNGGGGNAPQQPATIGQEAKRQGLLMVRHLLNAAASPAVLLDRVQAKASDALTGQHIGGSLGEDLNARLTSLGLPTADRPIEGFTQAVAQAATSFALPASLPAQMLGNAAIGAAQSMPGEEGTQAAIGGVAGLAGSALARTMGGIVRPTAEAQTLIDRGVALTPGQAAGAGSRFARMEQAATSLPFAGAPIRNAQRRAVAEANRAAAQAVVDVPDLVRQRVQLGMPPREAIEQARETVKGAYDQALTNMDVPALFPQSSLLSRLNDLPEQFPLLPARDLRQMERFVNARVADLAKNSGGTITGQQLKQLDSELGQHVRNLASSTNAADKTAAPAWAELQQSLREVMTFAQADPAKQSQLRAANQAYRQLLAVERALLPGAESFTPRQLARQLDKAKIRGTDLNTVGNAMTATLPNVVPDSGTAERLLMTSLPALLVGGGAGAQQMGFDTLGSGMIAAGALGSRPGARFMVGGYGFQSPLAQALRRGVPSSIRATSAGSIPSGAYAQRPGVNHGEQ